MMHLIIVNGTEFSAFDWTEAPLAENSAAERHSRDETLLLEGVRELAPGEVSFRCDQTLAFDTTFEQKGDGRKFVIIASDQGAHVAKPY